MPLHGLTRTHLLWEDGVGWDEIRDEIQNRKLVVSLLNQGGSAVIVDTINLHVTSFSCRYLETQLCLRWHPSYRPSRSVQECLA